MDPCLAVNGHGVEYREFTCIYPFLKPFYAEWEPFYDPIPVMNWMSRNSWVPIAACIVYAIGIFGGQMLFENRNRWHWKRTLTLWNLGLSIFSGIGFLRTAPNLFHNLINFPLEYSFCVNPEVSYGSGSTGVWVQLFILSKFPELLDTFFIVIHKKKLIFLHWYHHITVLLYCWHSYVTTSPPGIFFVVMNYAVHSVMYLYYALMAMNAKPKWWNPITITAAQISQMVVGVACTLAGFYFSQATSSCHLQHENNTAAFLMYGSYLFLFAQFFVGRYISKGQKVAPLPKKLA